MANNASKYRIYTESSQRARGAPTMRLRRSKIPTASPQCRRQAAALSLSMFKKSPPRGVLGDGTARIQRVPVHSVAGDCTTRTSAICNVLGRCGKAVRWPFWCDRGFMFVHVYVHVRVSFLCKKHTLIVAVRCAIKTKISIHIYVPQHISELIFKP